MLEKLQYDWGSDTDVKESIELAKPNRLNTRKNLKRNIAIQHNQQYSIMDLIAIFTDEADKVCTNKNIANLIALESLNDYVKGHVNNIKFVL